MSFVIQAGELNTHSAAANVKPILAWQSLPGIEVKMLSCLHRQSTHMHTDINSKMSPADSKSEHSNPYNETSGLKFNKAQAVTEAQTQGTRRQHRSGP